MSDDSFQKTFNAPRARDPHGSGAVGVAPGFDLAKSAIGNPELIFITKDGAREVLHDADVFLDHVHLHCPVCRLDGHENGLRINAGTKAWHYEPDKQVVFPGWSPAKMMSEYPRGTNGRLSTEKFTCSWCNTRMAVDKNVVRLA